MQNVQDFVTSFISEDTAVTQEPATNSSKVDTQDNVPHVTVTQEPATDSIGVTQEPPLEELKIDNLDVTATQEPATSTAGVTQEPPADNHDLEIHQDIAAADKHEMGNHHTVESVTVSASVTQEPLSDE